MLFQIQDAEAQPLFRRTEANVGEIVSQMGCLRRELLEFSEISGTLFLEKALSACNKHQCQLTAMLFTNVIKSEYKRHFARGSFYSYTKDKHLLTDC